MSVPVGSQGIGSAEAGTKEFLLIFGGGSGEWDAGQYTIDEEAKKLVYGRKDRANRIGDNGRRVAVTRALHQER